MPLGGTAVGTALMLILGLLKLSQKTFGFNRRKCKVMSSDNFFHELSSQDIAVQVSGELKNLAVTLMKISNDLRWMNSGPLAGLSEIELKGFVTWQQYYAGRLICNTWAVWLLLMLLEMMSL